MDMLQPKESVTAALKRFSGGGAAAKKGANNAKGDKKGAAGNKEERDMDKFNKLTETADALLSSGYSDIYIFTPSLPSSPSPLSIPLLLTISHQ